MTTARSVFVAMSAAAALAALSAPNPARALPVDQYLKLRRESRADRRLTYADVSANIPAAIGKVIELRGTVNGSIRREQAVSFMLTLAEDRRGILLDAPPADVRLVSEVSNQGVRVLAKVVEGKAGNLVPLQVLGVAYDAEVTLREKEAEEQQAVMEARARQSAARAQEPAFASRGGGYTARQMGGQGTVLVSGEVSEQARRSLSSEAQAIYPTYKAFIQRCNRRLTPRELDDITCSVLYFSQAHRVDPRLVCAMIIAESDFNPRTTSHKGAMGLGQLMPDEARAYRLSNPYDPIGNVGAAVGLLKEKLIKYSEGAPEGQLTLRQVQLALAAYNAGPGAVKKYGGIPPYKETQGYVKKILKLYNELCGRA